MRTVDLRSGGAIFLASPEGLASQATRSLSATVIALFVSVAFLWPAWVMLRRLNVVDVPNERSSHAAPTVRGLGVALLAAWVVSAVALSSPPMGFLVGVIVVVLLGALDDYFGLSPKLRLVAQGIVCFGIGWVLVSEVKPALPWLIAIVIVTVFLTATINAVNFMDGINGISALHAILWSLTYSVILLTYTQPDSPWPIMSAALGGSFAAFLPFNARRSALGFLGDSGSYGLGVIVGSLAIVTWAVTGSWIAALFPLGIYGLDTALTAARRIAGGHSLLAAHRDHIYQNNSVTCGSASCGAVVSAMASMVLCIAAVLFALTWINTWQAVLAGLVAAALYVASPRLFRGAPMSRSAPHSDSIGVHE